MQVQIAVVVLSAAGDHHDFGSQILQNGHSSGGCAAAAQHQAFFALQGKPAAGHQRGETEKVGIMSHKRTVRPSDYRVDGTQSPGGFGKLRAEGDDGLFIGDRYIQTVKVRPGEKFGKRFRLFFKEDIAVVAQRSMDLRGVAVSQLAPQ